MSQNADELKNKLPQKDLKEIKEDVDKKIHDITHSDDLFDSNGKIKFSPDDIYNLSIPATIDSLEEVLNFVNGFIQEIGVSPKIEMQLDIAVEELFVNIAHYAYKKDIGNADISLQITNDPKAITIEFRDSGKPFNPLEREDPDTSLSAEKRNIGGLGIFMAKKSVDEIAYRRENDQNILTIRKYL